MNTYEVFRTYNGFGFYDSAGMARLYLALPKPDPSNPSNRYIYQYANISSKKINGLVVNMKLEKDSGNELEEWNPIGNRSKHPILNYESLLIDLNKVPPLTDSNNKPIAEPFDTSKHIIVFIYHDAETSRFLGNNMKSYQALRAKFPFAEAEIEISPLAIDKDKGEPFAPAKNGFGVLKKM